MGCVETQLPLTPEETSHKIAMSSRFGAQTLGAVTRQPRAGVLRFGC